MDATQLKPSVREISVALSKEIRDMGQDERGFNGTAIVSSFKNVVCMDFRMSLLDLPKELVDIYDVATSTLTRVYDASSVADRIDAIGKA